MVDLKERFQALDQVPAPDLEQAIALRLRHYSSVPGALGAADPGKAREPLRSHPRQILAAAVILLLGIGLAAGLYYGRITPAHHKSSPRHSASSGSGSVFGLQRIHMVSASHGWANADGLVFQTSDGGANWADVTPADLRTSELSGEVAFLDEATAWILSSSQRQMDIRRTGNAGKSWQRIASFSIVPWYSGPLRARSVTFVDRQHGWFEVLLEQPGPSPLPGIVVYRTTDGGAHWDEVSVSEGFGTHSTRNALPVRCGAISITFVNQFVGWSGGNCTNALSLYRTHDGGQSWVEQALPFPPELTGGVTPESQGAFDFVTFSSARDGALIVQPKGYGLWLLYATHDGGATWAHLPLPPGVIYPRSVLLTGNQGWLAGEDQLFRTGDGGRHWTPVRTDLGQTSISIIQFMDATTGWALAGGYCVFSQCWPAGGSALLKTTDGGRTWTVQWETAPYTIEQVTFVLSDSGCAYQGPVQTSASQVTIVTRNETTDEARFDLWRLDEGHSYAELAAYFDQQQKRIRAGKVPLGNPDFATRIKTLIAGSGAPPNSTPSTWVEAGGETYAMSCSRPADKPTTVFLAGPFKT
jgi:photosystem II stability/assembly factor-like uncharacterized protein